jgi:hypothetical protein
MGIMGRTPFAGVAWQVLHYLEGFRRLGHGVHYLEDTQEWPFDPERNTLTDDCGYTLRYLSRVMSWCGLADRWAYRAEAQGGRIFGLSESQFWRVLGWADVLINLHGATALRDEHLRVPVRIYLETDPVQRQVEVAKGVRRTIDHLDAHTHHFTFAENLGAPDCRVPLSRFDYRPTRQPIILDWWAGAHQPGNGGHQVRTACRFTTIASWQQQGHDVEWEGETFLWSKHVEFLKFINLPRRARLPLEVALACRDPEVIRMLTSYGWRILDAVALSKEIHPYRDYIIASGGEFTVAKDQNIRLRSGWFSDRSASYMAAGLPVVTQDTGFGNVLPTGEGLFAFRTMEEILSAFEAIEGEYERHCRAARSVAEEYFGAETVLGRLMDAVGL